MHVQCTCRACSAHAAHAGSIAPACGCFCLWIGRVVGPLAACLVLQRGHDVTTPIRPAQEPVVGRKEPAAPLAQAAAGLHVAEPVCLACAFLNPACMQKRHVITGIRRPSFSCPRACAPRASASRAAPGSTVPSLRQCACTPVVRANILHLQDRRRSTNRIPHHTPAPAYQRLCELLSARLQNALYRLRPPPGAGAAAGDRRRAHPYSHPEK